MFEIWAGQCGRLIPQWSQDCLEACCVWSLSGHFNISPSSWIGPHVAPAITRGSPSSFFLPPSAGLPHPAAAVCYFVVSTKLLSASQIPLFSLCFLHFIQTWNITEAKHKVWQYFAQKSYLPHIQTVCIYSSTDIWVWTVNLESIISLFSLNSVFTLSLICQHTKILSAYLCLSVHKPSPWACVYTIMLLGDRALCWAF